jgi:hypothetical protein
MSAVYDEGYRSTVEPAANRHSLCSSERFLMIGGREEATLRTFFDLSSQRFVRLNATHKVPSGFSMAFLHTGRVLSSPATGVHLE